jgi:hypothetical protein
VWQSVHDLKLLQRDLVNLVHHVQRRDVHSAAYNNTSQSRKQGHAEGVGWGGVGWGGVGWGGVGWGGVGWGGVGWGGVGWGGVGWGGVTPNGGSLAAQQCGHDYVITQHEAEARWVMWRG